MNITVKNVSIGDEFSFRGRRATVVDITKNESLKNGEIINYFCYAKMNEGFAMNVFEVPFSTVSINKIK